eukprot:COSAG01_NODE_16487_length_1232_cov_5.280671_1_plen_39_part_10
MGKNTGWDQHADDGKHQRSQVVDILFSKSHFLEIELRVN